MRCDARVEKGVESHAFAARLVVLRDAQQPAEKRIEPFDLSKDKR
jgi:hypothetical protein